MLFHQYQKQDKDVHSHYSSLTLYLRLWPEKSGKKKKKIIKKEEKLSLFIDDKIIYVEILMESIF